MKPRKNNLKFLLAAISGVLIFLSFPAFNFYYLGWLAFVPLFLALEGAGLVQAYLLGLACGVVGVSGGLYWMGDFVRIVLNIPFPFNFLVVPLFALYAGQIFALITLIFQYLRRSKILGDVFLFPIVHVSVFYMFPQVFDFKMSDGQSYFLTAIQAIDHVGAYGLEFVIALANILLYKLIRPSGKEKNFPAMIAAFAILSIWFGYGAFSLRQWDDRITSWEKKKIGLVQPNRPASIRRPKPKPNSKYNRLYPLEMEISENLSAKGADIIFWPEGHFFGYSIRKDVRKAFKNKIGQMGVPIVFFDPTYQMANGQRQARNTSIWVDGNGNFKDWYHKIRLVPFGEYTPFIGKVAFAKEILSDFLSDLTPGTEHKTFEAAGMKIVPKICYESIFPEFTAEAIGVEGRGKVILIQSQNGWYGETNQPEQHMTASALRAVENRIPLIHVMNNGPSAAVLPNGRYAFSAPSFTQGGWIAEMPFNELSGGSFYSEHPYLFSNLVRAFFVLLLLWSLAGRFIFTRKIGR